MTDTLKLEDFAPYLGKGLKVEADGFECQFELVEAEPSKLSTNNGFSLLFRHPDNVQCTQGNYNLHIQHLDAATTVFMTPVIGSGQSGGYLEAIFN